ncbi:MAG: FHA domain-containing protein [Planctomycetota bacterium]
MGLQVHVSFNGRPLKKWPLDRPLMNIGRSPDNEIQLDAQVVSRRHAALEQAGAGWQLRDHGTVNGTYLNGARLEGTSPLKEGDTIQIGSFALVVSDDQYATHVGGPLKKPDKRGSGEGWVAVAAGERVTHEDREARERSATARAYLTLNSGPPRTIEKDVYQVGKDAACDLRLEGVFAPRKLALIVRGHGGWKLVNVTTDGKRVERNGSPVPDQSWLDDGDRLLLLDTEVVFHEGSP